MEVLHSFDTTNNHYKILDLGCGNGLLLKHLLDNSYLEIEPFGVDFLENSILQAKNLLHKEFQSNFICCNFIDYDFSHFPYDFVFLDPYHLQQNEVEFITKVLKHTKTAVIFYTYYDVLENLKYNSVKEFPILKPFMLDSFEHQEMSFAILHKK
ncbi:class I SAM-dependent methyltransferase [Algoriphagus sp. H41]|uniref:Class I SAM-dependent methyltransferase n=1 Tax=Algoriphagus oliviformis TaxID=2811231 RepID=A0ABS3C9A0_9BACT|nr:class I SAM-dependent methyltransferase [Algoriphagus oliviformis]MBN7813687.1 class I SAM-dependent methyltransferase [Algoriphagus oliviformis]